jgi:hypothetical protein
MGAVRPEDVVAAEHKAYCLDHKRLLVGFRTLEQHVKCDLAEVPAQGQLEEWVLDSVCETPDECLVEPDGRCEDGYPSWLMILGLV